METKDRIKDSLRVKEVMQEKGITGRELAAMMQTTPQYISNVINGSGVSLNVLAEIADKLKVDIRDLFISSQCKRELISLTEYKNQYYTATSIEELEEVVGKIKQDLSHE